MATTTSVTPLIEALSKQFELQTRLFNNVTADVSDEHASTRANANTNHMAWLVGHTVSTRYMLANMLGVQAAEPFPELFVNGKGMSTTANYPSMAELLKDWPSITNMLMERLHAMTDADLIANAPAPVPTGKRIIDFITFIAHHEAYTIGQLGILRRFHGYDAMKYN